MKRADALRLIACARRLRKVCPATYPVQVRRGPIRRDRMGDCELVGKRFRVRISDRATYGEALDTLIHEWAHAMSWSEGHPTLTAHDETWGVCFAKAYRALFPDLDAEG